MSENASEESSGLVARTLYGRRKGKKLRLHQAELVSSVLPVLAIDPANAIDEPAALFPSRPDLVRIEIGFGGAEHLVHEAVSHPEIGYIGCEPFVNGIAKLLVQIEDRNIANVRAHHGDAREILVKLPAGSIDRIDVLYPDPWPKWRQRKRRFLSSQNIAEIGRVLRVGGVLRFATDIDDYAGWVLARLIRQPGWKWEEGQPLARAWTDAWANWPGTRYEAKAFREGRSPVYLTFTKTD
ncbi:MAG: tRNA ((7)-)-methyltransferase [Hyphomicrobiales bacterium]|nr:tRNA ((7)-)-methyltransferase [Hyphomicrobiales bacterium]